MPAPLHRGTLSVAAWLVAIFALSEIACAAPRQTSEPPRAGAASLESGWLQSYLRFDTTNPPGNERPAVDWLAKLLGDAGIRTEILVSPAGRPSLVARLPATVADAPVVVLLHHVDVVPPGPGWSRGPFSGELADQAIWGRGAIDTKGLGIAHLAAMIDAAKLPHRQRELLFLATADEEAGGLEGVGWLLETHPRLLSRVEGVLNEGGATKAVAGRRLYWGIEVDQKRPLWLEVKASGRGGHASNADPRSATHRLVAGLARLVETPAPLASSRAAAEFLTTLGALDPRAARAAGVVRAWRDGSAPSAADAKAIVGYENLLRDSLQITTLAGADKVNVVAAEARAEIDVRLLPETDAEAFLEEVRRKLGADLEVRVLLSSPASGASPTASPVYRTLAETLAQDAPVIPIFIPSFTDARFFRARGIPAYGFSPFALEAAELLTVHGRDERMPVAVFDRGLDTMKRVVRRLVAP